jgi:hypothetical protein
MLALVVYNSNLWESGEWDTNKSKWVYWRDK